MDIKNYFLTGLTVILLSACATKTVELDSAEVLSKYASVSELKQLLATAQRSGVDYLAPEGFEKSTKIYEQAFDQATAQREGANELAQSGLTALKAAMKSSQNSKTIMRTVLDAREKTIQAGAATQYAEKFSELESRLSEANTLIENGKLEKAKKTRAGLIKDYSSLELESLMKSTTRMAKAKVAEAKRKDADDYAPKTYKLAQEELALALDVLSAGRTQTQKAQEHAELSVYYADKSIQITELIMDFESRDFSNEDLILWHQEQLEIVNKPFNMPLAFNESNYDVVMGMQQQIDGALALKEDLYAAHENIETLEAKIQSMDSQHQKVVSGLNQRMQGDKEENRKAQARYNKIQSMFTEEEAMVFRQGNNVLLETHAFNFKVGGSEIDSGNYDLLEKIMDAIKVFDNPDIIIRGHTDSTGSAALNMKLSQKRAETVSSFLKKVGKLSATKISTTGYGETRPVASNETKEGRERNRRIEVLIVNK